MAVDFSTLPVVKKLPEVPLQNTILFGKIKKRFNLDADKIERYLPELISVIEAEEACNNCQGREKCPHDGFVPKFDLNEQRLILTECVRNKVFVQAKRVERLLRSSRLPEHFKTKTFETFTVTPENQRAFNTALKVAGTDWPGVIFGGTPGTGKTHLATAILNKRINDGREAIFCTVPELLTDIKSTFRSNQDTSELIEIVKNAELLILDDLGAERTTDWVTEQLYTIINARYNAHRQTVVTTNYTSNVKLIEKLSEQDRFGKVVDDITGKRIVSRLCEMCIWVKLTGKDWRLTG